MDALEVITSDPQVQGDPLQHLRRDHALRRGRARDPRGARPDDDRSPDRRATRRDERGGGARGCSPRPRRRTSTSRRRCSPRPSASSSSRARDERRLGRRARRPTAQSDGHREGPDLDLLVEWADGTPRTALDVATRRGSRRAAPARGRARGRQPATGARDEPGRRLPRRGLAVRRRELRRRRLPGRARTTSPTSRRPWARWRA